jgi:CheY-like chemotaxis protein
VLTALIVDDMAIVRTTLGRVVGSAGLAVVEACDGKSTLAAYEACTPDVVLLDLHLGPEHGLDILRSRRRIPGYA